ncbi:MAG: serine/threonine-protein kinase, partial [Hyalangium sp.]|uniref:serine/threonine-protein kinase n=1 Tax=Hyalangium sp. TaxID=2028555 RepID=UPI003899E23C
MPQLGGRPGPPCNPPLRREALGRVLWPLPREVGRGGRGHRGGPSTHSTAGFAWDGWTGPRGRSCWGTRRPFFAMEWVDGVPLYDWTRQHPPSPARVLRLLAQLAGALQELHAQGGVHRDLKGDNILVRSSDGRAMLTDFGSGTYPDASPLTPPAWHPGTPAYRSPEAALLELYSPWDHSARHAAGPADDLYSLGVTACRLLTGEYPQPGEFTQDEHG